MTIATVVFDLDGVLIDSEPMWEQVRHEFVTEHHGAWPPGTQRLLMGMSTQEWSQYLAGELGVALPPEEIARAVTERMATRYQERLPVLPGAAAAVERLAQRWPLGLASSSPARLIERALAAAELTRHFAVVMSTEEVGRGKPAPDVYLTVAERLGVVPTHCAAVEDSTNGLKAAKAAGMRVIAVPRPAFPPERDALAAADMVLFGLKQLSVDAVERLNGTSPST